VQVTCRCWLFEEGKAVLDENGRVRNTCATEGIAKGGSHLLRRTLRHPLARKGERTSATFSQKLLGHASLETTAIYTDERRSPTPGLLGLSPGGTALARERLLKRRASMPIDDNRGRIAYTQNMTQIAEKLDEKLTTWDPQTASEVERMVAEIIELADNDVLDILPSRAVVQEVLDMIDED
jgi:hypothetical protein